MVHELNQQIQADDLEREQLVAETKNETNKSKKMVAMEMKKWLDSGAVRDVAPIKQKRKELEEKARIQRIDDQFVSDYLIYGKKMNKFQNLTIPIMQHWKWVAAPVAANPSSSTSTVLPAAADHQILCGIYHGVCKELKVIQEANVAPQLGKYLHDIIPRDSRTIADKNKGVLSENHQVV